MRDKALLSTRDAEALRKAQLALERLGMGATLKDIFDAIGPVVSLSGCFLESYTEARPWEATHASAVIPGEITDGIMAQRGEESQEPLRVVAQTGVGSLVNAHEALPERVWEEIGSYQLLVRNGFAHASALKLRTVGFGRERRHTYLALFKSPGEGPVVGASRVIIESLYASIRGALDRMALPLFNRSGMLALVQMIQEQRDAFISLSQGHVVRILEVNRPAYVFAARYAPALGIAEARNVVPAFVARLMQMPISDHSGRRQIRHHEDPCGLTVTEMSLDPATYDLPEAMTLLLLKEVRLDAFSTPEDLARADALRALPPRMRQIVEALVYSGKDRKVIAQELGISVHTLHTEIKAIFRRFNVNRRSELVCKLR